ncbi:polysaccharide pyruvyl transferase family protein [Microbacterium sp. BG28]|uniref:polysaccharide pyruvyl transferase family protein n=1 Tax=Microbacterium sp. BG28 TaxID=3097356 RepID=UPI002A59B01B|nr:polysaccharide pyruvyl transferase family protein [Microbacterium sp. BG28]MDY0828147.1 polysaccharide pyruvyl transferase family protein [Microbacterium sp. BG28]
MYSATRQWNPGDEFILAGSRRIVDTALGPFDPLIYDRNPDIRPADGSTVALRNMRRPVGEHQGAVFEALSSRLRLGFFSNSVKFDSDLSHASLAVVAGSPEWATPRCWSFYDHVFRNGLPFLGLGLGSMPKDLPPFLDIALDKAAVVTTRSRRLAQTDLARRHGIDYLPCPALLSAPAAGQVHDVKRVGIVVGVPYADAVWANGLDEAFYEKACRSIDDLITRFSDEVTFEFVLHYIDEIPVVAERFPGSALRYSYDSADYVDIFADYDMVISTRVHGCGIAASLGIPSISLGHDFRSDTTDGFLSVSVDLDSAPNALTTAFEELAGRAAEVSAELGRHRAATLDSYVDMLRESLDPDALPSIDYGADAVVPIADRDAGGPLDEAYIESVIETTSEVAEELDEARASNGQLRSVLTAVEESKSAMAIELDAAREAVVRLEAELARAREAAANQPRILRWATRGRG